VLHTKNFGAVLEAARKGEDWAWRAIYFELAPPLLGYLRARRAARPEELLGEVMVQIARDLPSFGGGTWDLRVWAFTIAHHRLLDERPNPQERVESIPDPLWAPGVERVGRLIARLEPDQQNVVLLRVLGELTSQEVASVIGAEADAVEALERRALDTLASELAEELAAK
jgi:DNA-directed RNA polymerase specialized sigma24 family protein